MNVGPVVMANPSLLVCLKQGNYTPLASLCALKKGPRYRFGRDDGSAGSEIFSDPFATPRQFTRNTNKN
jgi:hypothetical protein